MSATPLPSPKPIAGRDVFIAIGVAVLVYAFAAQIIPLLMTDPLTAARKQVIFIAYMAINVLALCGAVLAIKSRNNAYSWSDFGVRPADERSVKLAFGLGLAAVPIVFASGLLLRDMLGVEPPKVNLLTSAGFSWIGAATVILYAGLLVPIGEELFFRGVLFSWLRTRMSASLAIPLSAGAFAAVHWRLDVMILSFAMGCVLAWLYERSRSILPCILMHQTYNTALLVFVYGATAMVQGRSAAGG